MIQQQQTSIFKEALLPMEEFSMVFLKETGVNLYGFTAEFLNRTLAAFMLSKGIGSIEQLVIKASVARHLCIDLLEMLGVQYSSFFRNPEIFALLESDVLPALYRAVSANGEPELTIWSVGCSKGEEAVSLAVLADDIAGANGSAFVIHATDISEKALQYAQKGEYPRSSLGNIRLKHFEQYFTCEGGACKVDKRLLQKIHFSCDNIAAKPSPASLSNRIQQYHLVLCRNVLIYYSGLHYLRALRNVSNAVSVGGYLVLGEAETMHPQFTQMFTQLYAGKPIYRKNSIAAVENAHEYTEPCKY